MIFEAFKKFCNLLFIYLSKKYNTKIVVNQARLEYIKCMNLNHKKYFSLKEGDGWI